MMIGRTTLSTITIDLDLDYSLISLALKVKKWTICSKCHFLMFALSISERYFLCPMMQIIFAPIKSGTGNTTLSTKENIG